MGRGERRERGKREGDEIVGRARNRMVWAGVKALGLGSPRVSPWVSKRPHPPTQHTASLMHGVLSPRSQTWAA